MAAAEVRWTIGVDIGGTFTDGYASDTTGRSHHAKVMTTRDEPARGVMSCVEELARSAGVTVSTLLQSTVKFAHGQTTTLNAMVQRRGARTGLITTRGFRDTLRIMNVSRSAGLSYEESMDSLTGVKPDPLVLDELIEEVTERVDYRGQAVVPLDLGDARRAIDRLLGRGVEALAIALLWSFRNPRHEEALRSLAAELAPELPITISSDIAPVIGEYERTVTTVANAYLAPALDRYVHDLEGRLREKGLQGPCLIMQSSGGLMPAREAPEVAVTTLVSGLSGGVMGSLHLGRHLGAENLITADMGGTSFEVSLIVDGRPIAANYPLGPNLGKHVWRWRLAVPTIDITAIGAGGGSIAWIDDGVLKVGPVSAEADPGPACYGRGGTEPTITDADLVLGYLNPGYFLGGRMKVDKEAAERAILTKVAEPLGLDLISAARGIVEVANNQIADLVQSLTLNKGHDPREFSLVVFGGCGPLHVGHFGVELGVRSMIVPGRGLASVHSALGVAASDFRHAFAQSVSLRTPLDDHALEAAFAGLEQKARDTLERWGLRTEEVALTRSADMKYVRQMHTLEVPVRSCALRTDAAALLDLFETQYQDYYGAGTAAPEAGIEITTCRVTATAPTGVADLLSSAGHGSGEPSQAYKGQRPVYIRESESLQPTDIYEGELLTSGNVLPGPCVIEYMGTTVFVHANQAAKIDPYFNVVIAATDQTPAHAASAGLRAMAGNASEP